MRIAEGMLGIVLAGGIPPRTAAWAIDALALYVNAYTLELSMLHRHSADQDDGWMVSRDELLRRFAALPADDFPHTKGHAAELIAGEGHDRFDFTVSLMIGGLAQR
jgi:hypothetical protein